MSDFDSDADFDIGAAITQSYDSMESGKRAATGDALVDEVNIDPAGADDSDAGEEENTDPSGDDGLKPADDGSQPLKPHDRWSAELKAKFAGLPREAQEILLSRETEQEAAFTRKTQELSEQRKGFEEIEAIIAPRRAAFQAHGLPTDSAAIGHLFELSDMANRDPVGFLQHFIRSNNIDLSKLFPQQASPAQHAPVDEDEYVDPVVANLKQTVESMQQRLHHQDQQQEQQRLIEAQARQQAVLSDITAFENAKDAAGNAVNPHFKAVKGIMAGMMRSGTAQNLEQAYKLAVWANPEVRAQLQAEQKTAEDAARISKAKEAAAKAEKAKGVTVKSRGERGEPAKSKDWQAGLEDAYDRIVGAV